MRILEYANILEDFSTTSYEDWQTQRKAQTGLGGSDAGTILGLNTFKDEYTLYLEKIGELPAGEAGEAAEWGHALEPVVAEKWQERIGKTLGITIEPFPYLLQSKEYPFMLANMDRLIRKDEEFGILEVKTASEYLNGEWANGEILSDGRGGGKVPPKYYAQLQHYFCVTGLEWGYFAALVGGNKLYSVYVERNHDYIQALVEAEALFMQRLETGIPPGINGSETCRALIGTLYQQKTDEYVETDDVEFGEWLLERNELKTTLDWENECYKTKIAPMEERLTFLENNIKAAIGNDKGMNWSGWRVTWSERAGRKTVDVKILEEKYPEIFAEVVKTGEHYRQLSVAKPKTKGKISS